VPSDLGIALGKSLLLKLFPLRQTSSADSVAPIVLSRPVEGLGFRFRTDINRIAVDVELEGHPVVHRG